MKNNFFQIGFIGFLLLIIFAFNAYAKNYIKLDNLLDSDLKRGGKKGSKKKISENEKIKIFVDSYNKNIQKAFKINIMPNGVHYDKENERLSFTLELEVLKKSLVDFVKDLSVKGFADQGESDEQILVSRKLHLYNALMPGVSSIKYKDRIYPEKHLYFSRVFYRTFSNYSLVSGNRETSIFSCITLKQINFKLKNGKFNHFGYFYIRGYKKKKCSYLGKNILYVFGDVRKNTELLIPELNTELLNQKTRTRILFKYLKFNENSDIFYTKVRMILTYVAPDYLKRIEGLEIKDLKLKLPYL